MLNKLKQLDMTNLTHEKNKISNLFSQSQRIVQHFKKQDLKHEIEKKTLKRFREQFQNSLDNID